jgi:hypothetical protein
VVKGITAFWRGANQQKPLDYLLKLGDFILVALLKIVKCTMTRCRFARHPKPAYNITRKEAT